MDAKRERRLRRMLGTDEPLDDGFLILSPDADVSGWNALPPGFTGGMPWPIALLFGGIGELVLARRNVARGRGRLPLAPLAVGVSGDDVLVGRRGKVLRRLPAHEVLSTARRPRLLTELTIDGQEFVAGGVEGDIALRLAKVSRSAG